MGAALQRPALGAHVHAADAGGDRCAGQFVEPVSSRVTCRASSRVGATASASGAPAWAKRSAPSRRVGASARPKATVLPEPVWAETSASGLPVRGREPPSGPGSARHSRVFPAPLPARGQVLRNWTFHSFGIRILLCPAMGHPSASARSATSQTIQSFVLRAAAIVQGKPPGCVAIDSLRKPRKSRPRTGSFDARPVDGAFCIRLSRPRCEPLGRARRRVSPFHQNHGQNDRPKRSDLPWPTALSRVRPGGRDPHRPAGFLQKAKRRGTGEVRWVSRLRSSAPPAMWAAKC